LIPGVPDQPGQYCETLSQGGKSQVSGSTCATTCAAGLTLVRSGDLSSSASRVTVSTGVSHHAWLSFIHLEVFSFLFFPFFVI
jgi:hypothetical protein